MNATDWINLTTAIATLSLSLLTGGYLIETRNLRKLNEKSMERDNSELSIAMINSKYFEKHKFFSFGIEIVNTGLRKASLIRIKGVRSLKKDNIRSLSDSIKSGGPTVSSTLISYLEPKEKGYFYCEIDKDEIKPRDGFELSIAYRDSYKEDVLNTYQIRLAVDRNEYSNSRLMLSKVVQYKQPLKKPKTLKEKLKNVFCFLRK